MLHRSAWARIENFFATWIARRDRRSLTRVVAGSTTPFYFLEHVLSNAPSLRLAGLRQWLARQLVDSPEDRSEQLSGQVTVRDRELMETISGLVIGARDRSGSSPIEYSD
jgi:hypothetical protein